MCVLVFVLLLVMSSTSMCVSIISVISMSISSDTSTRCCMNGTNMGCYLEGGGTLRRGFEKSPVAFGYIEQGQF